MNKSRRKLSETRLDGAVRRAVGMRFSMPSLRSMLRACAVYANVIALAVALGVPGSGLRTAAGSAMQAFESSMRSSREAVFTGPDMLSAPVDLSEVTEAVSEAPVATPAPVRTVETVSGVAEIEIEPVFDRQLEPDMPVERSSHERSDGDGVLE